MKKLISGLFLSAAVLSGLFVSCHDNIFELINKEVKLEKNGLNGDNVITRYADYLISCNGHIYYKTAKPSDEYYKETHEYNKQWKKTDSPDTSKIDYVPASTHFVASSGSTLYALVYSWYETKSGSIDVKTKNIWYTTSTDLSSPSWEKLETGEDIKDIRVIFDNKAVDSSGRKAYASMYSSTDEKYHVYELSGGSASPISEGTNGASSNTINAVYFPKDGQTYFSDYYAMAANNTYIYYSTSAGSSTSSQIRYADSYGTYDSYTSVSVSSDSNPAEKGLYEKNDDAYSLTADTTVQDGKNYYKKESRTGYILSAESKPAAAVSCDAGGILSMALTKDYMLLGTTSGLARTRFVMEKDAEGNETTTCTYIPSASKSSFANNGGSIISEYVYTVFTRNPEAYEMDDDEYCSSTINGSVAASSDSWEDAGLYAYYPGRGTWNRDGTSDSSSHGN